MDSLPYPPLYSGVLFSSPPTHPTNVFSRGGFTPSSTPQKGAEHKGNAERFVDWCISPEGQKVLMEATARVPATDVAPVEGVPGLGELDPVAYDTVNWVQEGESVIAAWNARYPQYGEPTTSGGLTFQLAGF